MLRHRLRQEELVVIPHRLLWLRRLPLGRVQADVELCDHGDGVVVDEPLRRVVQRRQRQERGIAPRKQAKQGEARRVSRLPPAAKR